MDEDPTIENININHNGGVNRLRVMPQSSGIIASMSDNSSVYIYDITSSAKSKMQKGPRVQPPTKPVFTFKGHSDEGFALDWSSVNAGQLATGDCDGNIRIWKQDSSSSGSGTWVVDGKSYVGHKSRYIYFYCIINYKTLLTV
jgi:ribosome assembly protein RRB1